MFFANETLDNLHTMVKEYFATDSFGVQPSTTIRESSENVRARQIPKSTTRHINGRYESGLLWRHDKVAFPDSFPMAEKRLVSVENKMKKDVVYESKYKQTICSYVQKGYARKLTTEEINKTIQRTWYLPHFGVLNPNKPDKFRLVFDAAASVGGQSLNSSLLSGPDMNQPLLSILSKFREGRVGVCGDIREMYHQIVIRPEDQHSQRFLWRNNNGEIDVYIMCAMTFGSTSSPATAQYVKNLNASRFMKSSPAAANAIIERHYVDDYVISFSSEEEAIEVTTQVKSINAEGGFELRLFLSNVPRVAAILNKTLNDQSSEMNMDLESSLKVDKIIGMVWDTATDDFKFNLNFNRIDPSVLELKRVPTKRELLAITMSVYDPFGFLADFLLTMKVQLQTV